MGEGGCDGRLHVTEGGRRECDKATGVIGLTTPWGVTRRIVCPFFLCRALLVFCCLPLFETFSLPTCTCICVYQRRKMLLIQWLWGIHVHVSITSYFIYSTAHAELKRERRVRALLLASFNV